MKPNENGTASEKWLHQVGYLSPKQRKAAGITDEKTCAMCFVGAADLYVKADDSRGVRRVCMDLTNPSHSGLVVKDGSTCKRFTGPCHD